MGVVRDAGGEWGRGEGWVEWVRQGGDGEEDGRGGKEDGGGGRSMV